jgi:hypothetical protein
MKFSRAALILPRELADSLGLSIATLADWRSQKRGPTYLAVGRKIWYPKEPADPGKLALRNGNIGCRPAKFSDMQQVRVRRTCSQIAPKYVQFDRVLDLFYTSSTASRFRAHLWEPVGLRQLERSARRGSRDGCSWRTIHGTNT